MEPQPGEAWEETTREDALELVQALRALAGIRTVDELASTTAQVARGLIEADGVTFVLNRGEEVDYVEENVRGKLWNGRRFPLSACISGWAVRHDSPAVVADVFDDDRIPGDAYRPTFVRSMAMIPLRSALGPVGAVGVYWAEPHRADDREMFLLGIVADAASRVLESASLLGACEDELVGARDTGAPGLPFEMLSVAAHDLRSPLAAARTGVELLKLEELSSRGQIALTRMASSLSRAERLVGDLFDYACRPAAASRSACRR